MPPRERWVIYGTSICAESSRWPWRRCGGAWVAELRRRAPDAEILNRSGWGWTSRDALRRFSPRVLAAQPDLAVFEFAANDADRRRGISPERSARNLGVMIDALGGARPRARVVLLIPPPPTGAYGRRRPRWPEYADAWRAIGRQRECSVADLDRAWAALASEDPAVAAAMMPDGLHPSPAAAEWIAQAVLSACRAADFPAPAAR